MRGDVMLDRTVYAPAFGCAARASGGNANAARQECMAPMQAGGCINAKPPVQ